MFGPTSEEKEIPIPLPVYVKKNMAALKESDDHLIKEVYACKSMIMDQNKRINDLSNKFDELNKQRQAEFLNKVGIGPTANVE